jgi:uncharacterized membrane protein
LKVDLKKIFLTGLAVAMPVGFTLYIFFFLIGITDSLLLILPVKYQPDVFLHFHVPGLGTIVTLLLIFLTGLMTRSYFGNKLVTLGERLLDMIPFVRNVYQAMKQVADTIFRDRSKSFKKVVLFRFPDFPNRNVYSVGFVTGFPTEEFTSKIGHDYHYVSVFMPTAPNPTTGLYMIMPEDELIYIDISVEEAFTMIISTGIVMPVEHVTGKTD